MRRSLAERLDAMTGPSTPTGCREWQRGVNNSGYGLIRVGGRDQGKILAHRAAWQIARGPIAQGLVVMHLCNNKRCLNVEHLKLGTQLENIAEAVSDGLVRRSRFTPEQVDQMAKEHAAGASMKLIARTRGVSRPLISLLLSGKLKSSPFAKRRLH